MWERWRSGDREAGARLLELYEGAIYGTIRRLGVRDAAAAADVYADLIVALAEYKEVSGLRASFFGLCRRMIVSIVMRRRRREPLAAADGGGGGVDPPDRGEDPLPFFDALEQCMRRLLRPLEAGVFRDRFLGGLDNRALAQRYHKSANHIAVIVHAAVAKMRACLAREGFAA